MQLLKSKRILVLVRSREQDGSKRTWRSVFPANAKVPTKSSFPSTTSASDALRPSGSMPCIFAKRSEAFSTVRESIGEGKKFSSLFLLFELLRRPRTLKVESLAAVPANFPYDTGEVICGIDDDPVQVRAGP